MTGAGFGHQQGKVDKEIVKEVAALKIDGCMDPLPKIEGCSCTRRTHSNKGPDVRQSSLLTADNHITYVGFLFINTP